MCKKCMETPETSWTCIKFIFFPSFSFLILYRGRNLFPCVVLEPPDPITRLKNLSRFHYYFFTGRGEDFTLATLSYRKSQMSQMCKKYRLGCLLSEGISFLFSNHGLDVQLYSAPVPVGFGWKYLAQGSQLSPDQWPSWVQQRKDSPVCCVWQWVAPFLVHCPNWIKANFSLHKLARVLNFFFFFLSFTPRRCCLFSLTSLPP